MSGSDFETQLLLSRAGYLKPILVHAVGFAIGGPRWVPACFRRVPLAICGVALRVALWRLRHGY